jgi:hypothetical protein
MEESIPEKQEALNEKLLGALEEYAQRLSRDNAAYIELRWNYYIKAAAAISAAGLILLAMAYVKRFYSIQLGWELFSSVLLTVCAFLVILTAQFLRTQNRLVAQVRSESYLCKRLATRGSEMLEQSRLTNQDKFVLEIKLFEADKAVNEAETTFKAADLRAEMDWTFLVYRYGVGAVLGVIGVIILIFIVLHAIDISPPK